VPNKPKRKRQSSKGEVYPPGATPISEEYFEGMMKLVLNWIVDCEMENAALREALQRNGGVTYAQVQTQRQELEQAPEILEMRRFINEGETARLFALLEKFQGPIQ
jgi:hypothetical protein